MPTLPPDMRISRLPNGKWIGYVRFTRADGSPLTIVATSDERAIRREVAQQLMGQGVNVGAWSGFKKLKSMARKIARARVIKKMAGAIQDVAKSPLLAKAVGLAAFVPGVSSVTGAVTAARSALHMIEQAKRGHVPSLNSIRTVMQRAASGDPQMARAAQILQTVARGRGTVLRAQATLQNALPRLALPAQCVPCAPSASSGAWEGSRYLARQLRPYRPLRAQREFTLRDAYYQGLGAISR